MRGVLTEAYHHPTWRLSIWRAPEPQAERVVVIKVTRLSWANECRCGCLAAMCLLKTLAVCCCDVSKERVSHALRSKKSKVTINNTFVPPLLSAQTLNSSLATTLMGASHSTRQRIAPLLCSGN